MKTRIKDRIMLIVAIVVVVLSMIASYLIANGLQPHEIWRY